ncbi:NUDIX domain-containing protein [Methylocystis heyeri]|uniref:NUDIX domain-containing protein n=1 Tax=Methylocystis heyeri TaxID=391905 RepID=A0A6B8KBP8_9HYPH|nr:NUDIX domain-containing protein [Methylocystis heyeri]QGM44475.1 NUDIX domain-containing protein [Methylocystis heyeri]
MSARAFQYDYLVFIGRFQPLHNGHIHILAQALAASRKVIVLVGSANVARSPRNPFSYEERRSVILAAGGSIEAAADQIIVKALPDFLYNDQAWIAHVQRCVDQAISEDGGDMESRVGLIGHSKDKSSYYLRMFPNWSSVDVKTQHGTLNSSDIREDYLRRAPHIPDRRLCPEETIEFLGRFMLTEAFKWLVDETNFYRDYKASWGRTPYPVFINCVDAVVIQSGHILLVERARRPGLGLLALPGGHVDPSESLRDAAIRELKEETRISDPKGEIPPAMLASFIQETKTRLFDDPNRSERGRVVTQAYLFELPARRSLFSVRGDDDAASAGWHELGRLRADQFFEDHAAIIREMTGALID